ncbi:MAG: DUF393 domain-containing protein [Austwickia sp.]|nr:DUF393 domain-containing protein [Austwickia sp.]
MSADVRGALLFDGDCAFCAASIQWVRRRLAPAVPAWPFQEVNPAGLGVSRERLTREVVMVLIDGSQLGGADAFLAWAASGKGVVSRGAGLLCAEPTLRVARPIYRWVAKNRAHWRFPPRPRGVARH